MDVKVFQTFLEVAKEQHFGRAADNLYITQAAVSARVKQLESYFDNKLFERHKNNIRLTSAGERLVSYAQTMVSTLQQAKAELAMTEQHRLQLSIAGSANIWDAYLHHALLQITKHLTGYGLIAESLSREQVNRQLLDRTLDMALSMDPLKADEFYCQTIAELELVLVSTVLGEGATQVPYVFVDWGTAFAHEHAKRHQNSLTPFMRTSTGRIALDYILQQGGFAYLPRSMVQPFIDAKQLFYVADTSNIIKPIYLTYRRQSTSQQAIEQVQQLLQQLNPAAALVLQQAANQGSEQ
ncbi:LysR family transcriptional regulator [Motilimonas pumila]|uniref:LysR family transcriptional regulator n=1 Tax=Motilimonas pumila TaxID=2303987 RepID=A0A418YDP8_9GAMM|nr:LysR family transcriptional regulator [Motilimonas pumila]RJG42647.1 LysR family transcriptional regulator [Motilimonas pumila]